MLITVLISLFIGFGVMVFIAVALVFPEWVGIAGKKSQEIEAAHREGSPEQTSSGPGPEETSPS